MKNNEGTHAPLLKKFGEAAPGNQPSTTPLHSRPPAFPNILHVDGSASDKAVSGRGDERKRYGKRTVRVWPYGTAAGGLHLATRLLATSAAKPALQPALACLAAASH